MHDGQVIIETMANGTQRRDPANVRAVPNLALQSQPWSTDRLEQLSGHEDSARTARVGAEQAATASKAAAAAQAAAEKAATIQKGQ